MWDARSIKDPCALSFECIIHNLAAPHMHIVLSRWRMALARRLRRLFCDQSVRRFTFPLSIARRYITVCSGWVEYWAQHLSHCWAFAYLCFCLMGWDSLVNRSHGKQSIFARLPDYLVSEWHIGVQQYVICASVQLLSRLRALIKAGFQKDKIK